jgi:hypothetical protein
LEDLELPGILCRGYLSKQKQKPDKIYLKSREIQVKCHRT